MQVGEVDRARAIYVHASSLSDPRNDPGFWKDWNDFEVRRQSRPEPPCTTSACHAPQMMPVDTSPGNGLPPGKCKATHLASSKASSGQL